MLKALLLDLDGLLVDSERIAIKAWKLAGERVNYPIPDGFVERYIGKGIVSTAAGVMAMYPSAPIEEMKALRLRFGEELCRSEGVPAMLGAARLLELAKAGGLTLAVCTGSHRAEAMEKLGLAGMPFERHFSLMVCAEDVPHGKPAPDIFLRTASDLGYAPYECAVAEDSPAGMRAGLDANMRVMAVPDLVPVPRDLRPRVEVCNSLLDVTARLFGDKHPVRTLHLSRESYEALIDGRPTFGVFVRDAANRSLCLGDDVLCSMQPGIPREHGLLRAQVSGLFPYPSYDEMGVALGADPAFSDYFFHAKPAYPRELEARWGILGVFLWPN